MDQPVHSLAYGKRRLLEIALALACRPRVLLLDEPVAGVPEGERQEIFETINALPADVSILLIEHDMDLVFNFAKTVTVLVNGAVFAEGDVRPCRRTRASRRSTSARTTRMAELLRVDRPERRLRRGGRRPGRRPRARGGPLARRARPQRHRQDDAAQHADRRDAPPRRHDRARRPRRHGAGAARARRRRHRLGAAGAQHLQVAERRREPDRGGAPRAVDAAARLRDVPAPRRAARPTSATSSRAASSRCSRSRARSSSTRSCCSSTSRSKAWRRSSSRSCCARSSGWSRRRPVGDHRRAEPEADPADHARRDRPRPRPGRPRRAERSSCSPTASSSTAGSRSPAREPSPAREQ